MRYPAPNLDTTKASKGHLEKSTVHWQRFSSVKFTQAQCTQRARRTGKKGPQIVPNCLKFLGGSYQVERFSGQPPVSLDSEGSKRKLRVHIAIMASGVSSYYEGETHSDTSSGERAHRRHHRSGRHLRDEPNTLTELQECPLAMSCFQHLACYEFCERVANVRVHHELARPFALHLQGGQSILVGVTFTLSEGKYTP